VFYDAITRTGNCPLISDLYSHSMTDKLFSALLKYWRGQRGMSQLDLALAADVSARHVSFLESGRANPSQDMVLRLMSALQVPLRDQNDALRAADFPARFLEPALNAIDPAIDDAITRMMRQQEPYPLTVLSPSYDILRSNQAAQNIFSQFVQDPSCLQMPLNLYALVFDPQLARPFIQNWAQIGRSMLARLHREALSRSNDARLWALLEQVLTYPDVPQAWRQPDFSDALEPTLSLVLARGPLTLRFFTVLTTIAAPQQITLDELRIESYFPLDEPTRQACAKLSSSV
jgi:transcriptional regulator with XRE-family HTH domain